LSGVVRFFSSELRYLIQGDLGAGDLACPGDDGLR